MQGPAIRFAFRVLALVAVGTVGLSSGFAENNPISSGPIPSRPAAPRPEAQTPTAPITVAPDPVANPGKPKSSFRDQPMQLRIVRDGRPGCGKGCAEWIAAEGRIVPGTGEAFATVMRTLGDRRLPVFIDSGGGAVDDAMAMGRLIRERHLDVAVAQTIPDCPGCAPGLALPRSPGAVCASACVLVLAAGTSRVGGLATHVGVHQMSMKGIRVVKQQTFRVFDRNVGGTGREIGRELLSERTVSSTSFTAPASPETNDRVAHYLEAMGIGAGLMPLMLSTPSTSIRWLTPREERSTGLLSASNGGEVLLSQPQHAPGSRAGAPAVQATDAPAAGRKADAALPPAAR